MPFRSPLIRRPAALMSAPQISPRFAPSPRAWHALALVLLGLAVLPAIALFFDPGPDAARRSLVLHAGIASVVLPLCLLGQLDAGRRPTPAWTDRLLWLTLAGASAGLVALILSGAGQVLLLSHFPILRQSVQPTLLIGPVLIAAIALLLRPAPRRPGSDDGLGWLALPLLAALVMLAWSWSTSADAAPHVREELVAWGTGHAWQLVLGCLCMHGWLQLAEVGGQLAVRWTRAAALAAAGVLAVPAALPIASAAYLKTLNGLTLALLGLVPVALAIALLRDPIRRAVGGGWLLAAMLAFFVPWAAAAWLVLGAAPEHGDTLRRGPLLLQHGLGLAALTALAGALRRQSTRPNHRSSAASTKPRLSAGSLARLAAVAVAGGLVLALMPPQHATRPLDPAARQHASDRRQQEIAERFRQGVTMMQLRRYDDAVTAFHRVLELDPTIPEVHVNIGFALFETGQAAAAQRFFEAATRLNRNQLNAYYGLALTAQAQGAGEVAAGAMQTWLHLAPADDPFRARAEALFEQATAASRLARQALPARP